MYFVVDYSKHKKINGTYYIVIYELQHFQNSDFGFGEGNKRQVVIEKLNPYDNIDSIQKQHRSLYMEHVVSKTESFFYFDILNDKILQRIFFHCYFPEFNPMFYMISLSDMFFSYPKNQWHHHFLLKAIFELNLTSFVIKGSGAAGSGNLFVDNLQTDFTKIWTFFKKANTENNSKQTVFSIEEIKNYKNPFKNHFNIFRAVCYYDGKTFKMINTCCYQPFSCFDSHVNDRQTKDFLRERSFKGKIPTFDNTMQLTYESIRNNLKIEEHKRELHEQFQRLAFKLYEIINNPEIFLDKWNQVSGEIKGTQEAKKQIEEKIKKAKIPGFDVPKKFNFKINIPTEKKTNGSPKNSPKKFNCKI